MSVKADFPLCLNHPRRPVFSFRCGGKTRAGRMGLNLEFDLGIRKQSCHLMPLVRKKKKKKEVSEKAQPDCPLCTSFRVILDLSWRRGKKAAFCRLFHHLKRDCPVDQPCRPLVFNFQQLLFFYSQSEHCLGTTESKRERGNP